MDIVVNRHIRKDWHYLYPVPGKNRVKTMCGIMTTPKLAGIPGVTAHQPPAVHNAGDYGWCLACCAALIKEASEALGAIETPAVLSMYQMAMGICSVQLQLANVAHGKKQVSDVLLQSNNT